MKDVSSMSRAELVGALITSTATTPQKQRLPMPRPETQPLRESRCAGFLQARRGPRASAA